MSKVVIILGINWRINVGVEKILSVKIIAWYLISFLWQRITAPSFPQAPLSLTTSQVLIFHWDIHIHNQIDIFSLMMLMMGRPITHILLLRFHYCCSLHIQIRLKREIYLEREIKLILSANTSAENGPNQFGNEATMVEWNVRNWINLIESSMT